MRVLLIDDDTILLGYLRIAMEPEFEVRGCLSGQEGLRILQSEPVDVLMTDLDLPGVTGEELVRVARALPAPMGVIVFSGSRERLDRCRADSDAWLVKPFRLASVRAALRRAAELAQRRRNACGSGEDGC